MIETNAVDWIALEQIDLRRRIHGESMSAAIQFAKAHQATREAFRLLGCLLQFTHQGNFYTHSYPHLINGLFADAIEAIEQWEHLR